MMSSQNLSFSKTLNPTISLFPLHPKPFTLNPNHRLPHIVALAGRSKKNASSSSGGRIEGGAEVRRKRRRIARAKAKKMAESLFYRLKNPHKNNYADNFTEDELNMFGLGYDRMVRFMEKDDPNLKHPYDWYKYGEFGPYSWRGVVLGDPIRGRFTDECVTLYAEVKDHEEFEKIAQFEMQVDFGKRLKELDKSIGLRRYWVFVRHPRWRLHEKPWEQWTLVSEVAVEVEKEKRLDKWNLMGRLGNKARKMITKCAAWFRPDIVYVKRPVYQCRFEPQVDFFKCLVPYLDPETERNFLFEFRDEDGYVEECTYYEGLCKIVKVNKKAFVDDVVNAYAKLSDEKKSACLEFLLTNHPVQLLHPYTREWKAKLEEMELGCDAPDDDDDHGELNYNAKEKEFTEWDDDDEDGGDDQDVLMKMDEDVGDNNETSEDGGEELSEDEEEDEEDEEENEQYWNEKLKKAISSSEEMEKLVKRSVEISSAYYAKQIKAMQNQGKEETIEGEDGDETAMRGVRAKVSKQEWKVIGLGKWRKRIKKSKIPPQLFLRAAVKPFTYRNLVKEIVLTRHAILDGEIRQNK